MALTDKHKVKRQRLDRICEGKRLLSFALSLFHLLSLYPSLSLFVTLSIHHCYPCHTHSTLYTIHTATQTHSRLPSRSHFPSSLSYSGFFPVMFRLLHPKRSGGVCLTVLMFRTDGSSILQGVLK